MIPAVIGGHRTFAIDYADGRWQLCVCNEWAVAIVGGKRLRLGDARYLLVNGEPIEIFGTFVPRTLDVRAVLHGIHRATAARRLASVREALAQTVRDRLMTKLGVGGGTLDSIIRLVGS